MHINNTKAKQNVFATQSVMINTVKSVHSYRLQLLNKIQLVYTFCVNILYINLSHNVL